MAIMRSMIHLKRRNYLIFLLIVLLFSMYIPVSAFYQDGTPAYVGMNENDLNTLQLIYNQMTPEGINQSGWFQANDQPCTWNGIACDGNGSVIRLDFDSTDFFCFIPPEITNLTNLQELRLRNLGLRGILPSGLLSMPNLRSIEISGNLLTGNIPQANFPTPLQILILEDNRWTDAKQQNLNSRPNLSICSSVVTYPEGIDTEPGLDGSIPGSLGNLQNLQKLDLSGNNLQGEIPGELEYLYSIQSIDLSDNSTQNPLVISNPTLAQRFSSLPENNLSGVSMPQAIETPDYAQTESSAIAYQQTADAAAAIAYQQTADAAAAIAYQQTADAAAANKVVDEDLAVLYAIFNKMTPFGKTDSGWFMTESSCEWKGITCENHRVTELKFDSVDYFCFIPDEIANLSALRVLSLSNMGLRGIIPSGILSMANLTILNLSNNILSGSLPEIDPALSGRLSLQTLVIANNQLTAEKQSDLDNRPNLQICQSAVQYPDRRSVDSGITLSGGIPASFSVFSNLQNLDLSGNLLEGEIPSSLGDLSQLSAINLSNNNTENPLTISDMNLAQRFASLPQSNLSGVVILQPTEVFTETPVPVITDTAIPPTDVPTNTSVPPTGVPTSTSVPPTAIPSNTAIPVFTNTPIAPTAIPTNTPVPPTAAPTNTAVPPTSVPTLVPTNTPQPTIAIIIIVMTSTPQPTQPVIGSPTPIRWITATQVPWKKPTPYYWPYRTATPVPYNPPIWYYPTSSGNVTYPIATAYVPPLIKTPTPTVNPASKFAFNYVTEKMTSEKIPMTWKFTGMKEYMINFLTASRSLYPGFAMEWTPATKLCNASNCNYDIVKIPDSLLKNGMFYIQLQAKDYSGKIYQSDPIGFQVAGSLTPTPVPTEKPVEKPSIGSFFSRLLRVIFWPLIKLFQGGS
jgi:Leucine-rich repeat (LRR) protein